MPTGQPATAATAGAAARPPRVVLVDPDDAARALTLRTLTAGGCAVAAAVDSHAQGMIAARTHQPDAIVTELRGGTILTAPAYVTALHGQCPSAAIIVYATVIPAGDDVQAWGLWGALVKVVDAARLAGMVRAAFEAHHAAC